MKFILTALVVALPLLASAQDGNWGAPSDNASAWGGRTDDLNPVAPRNVHKLDREQPNPLNDSVIQKPTVANPFDSSGVSIGESQVLTGAGVDPSTGMTTPDSPRDTEN